MRQKTITSYSIFTILFFVLGCAPTIPPPALYAPQFLAPSFSAEAENAELASTITIALISPSYARQFSGDLGEHFQQSLAKDIERLLIEKGYKLLGPFQSLNEMTFPQKKQSDLTLSTIIDFNFQEPLRQFPTLLSPNQAVCVRSQYSCAALPWLPLQPDRGPFLPAA